MSLEGKTNVEYASLTGKIHTIVVDKTLTISGACADAKATGDKIETFEAKVDYANSSVEEAKKTYEGMITNMTEAAEAAAHEAIKTLSAEELGAYVKSQVLSDETKTLFGFGSDAVPNDVLSVLARLNLHCWEKEATVKQYVLKEADVSTKVSIVYSQPSDTTQKHIYYGDTVEMDESGNLSIPDEALGKVCYSGYSQGYSNPEIGGKYFTLDHELYYKVDEGVDFTRDRDKEDGEYDYFVDIMAHVVYSEEVDEGAQEYAFSTERNAYPDNGAEGDFYYTYMGVPLDNALHITRCKTGSYTGTGVCGSSNPNSLTFDFVPKVVGIWYPYTYSKYFVYMGQTNSKSAKETNYTWLEFSVSGKTFSWYEAGTQNGGSTYPDAEGQLNVANEVYWYFALG